MPEPDTRPGALRLLLTGAAMGTADLVPGVSGGTVALVLGVYDRLLDAIASLDAGVFRALLGGRVRTAIGRVHWWFVLPLGAGILTAILLLAEPLGRTLDDAEGRILLFAFFFGLVVASAVAVGGKVRWSVAPTLLAVAGGILAVMVVRATPASGSTALVAVFGSGMLAICAMVLPGISGSFVLLILGQYDNVLDAVRERQIVTLLVFVAGAAIGLAVFVRLLRRLLAARRNATLAVLVGFMAGSLWKVWPWRDCVASEVRHAAEVCISEAVRVPDLTGATVVAGGLLVAGIALVSLFDHWESGANPLVTISRRSQPRN